MKDVYIHPTAIVETEDIGEDTRIWAFKVCFTNDLYPRPRRCPMSGQVP
jgi:hypothetical protein